MLTDNPPRGGLSSPGGKQEDPKNNSNNRKAKEMMMMSRNRSSSSSRKQMRWLPNITFSSSSTTAKVPSSSSYSAAYSPKPDGTASPLPKPSRKIYDHRLNHSTNSNHYNINAANNNNGDIYAHHHNVRGGALGLRFNPNGGPKLTRQRKLRHLTDQDVVAHVSSESDRSPGRSSSPTVLSSRLSAPAAVPLPLPLLIPGGDLDDGVRTSSASPGAASRGGGKASEQLETKAHRIRKVRQELSTMENYQDNFGIKVPPKSATTSPYASPVISPQRASPFPADIIPYCYKLSSKGAQVWSAPELATLDLQGLPPPAFMDFSDNSPLPRSPSRSPRRCNFITPSGPASPLTARLSVESSFVHRECNATLEVHPLPRPPGPSVLSPPASYVRQAMPKSESPTSLKSQWQKGKLIGRGTFGSVYVASNRVSGALCAMKEVEIFPDDPKSAECIKQLEQEIKVLSQLKHQNIVQYYGSETVEDHFYIYIEYVHPGSINKYIHDHCGAMTENVVRSFTRHILSGLAYLHSKKTIHRDIKGANLLVDASGVVKLADFGMAKHLSGHSAILSMKGSPYWMAPELMQSVMQKDNSSDLAFAIDIWSLGCTIIEMFTGKPPWSEYEGAAAMFKVMKDTPPIPESLSPEGKDFLSCCLKRNPAERSTASMLLDHRWLKDLQQLDVPSSAQLINGIKLTDSSHSPRKSDVRLDPLSVFPSRSVRGKVISDSCMQNPFSPVRLASDPP